MEGYIRTHLAEWINNQFKAEDRGYVKSVMEKLYLHDPELFSGDRPWFDLLHMANTYHFNTTGKS